MKKILTIILTLFAFILTACAPTFKDPLLQKAYEACTDSKMSVATQKSKLADIGPLKINSLSNDKKAFCKSVVENLESYIKKAEMTKEIREKNFNILIEFFKTGKLPE